MTFNKTSDNNYHSTVDHETFGYLEWTEKFSGEGIQVVSNKMSAKLLKRLCKNCSSINCNEYIAT